MKGIVHLPSGVEPTSFTSFNGACQLLLPRRLAEDKLPPLIQDFLDVGGYIDDIFGGDHFVVTVHVPIKHLLVPEGIFLFPVLIQIFDLRDV